MKLEDFVKNTLLDITNGVHDAKKDAKLSIAPGFLEGEIIKQPQDVFFEIVVTPSKEGGGRIDVFSLGDAKASGKLENSHRLTFSVPVYFNAKPQRDD